MKRILLYCLLFVCTAVQAQDLLPYPTDTIDGKVYYRYTVEKSIGLYRISKNFGVSQEDILQANPELKERGLKFEEEILIPTNLTAAPQVKEKQVVKDLPRFRERAEDLPKPMQRTAVAEHTAVVVTAETAVVDSVQQVVDTVPMSEQTADSLLETALLADTVEPIEYTDTVRLVYMLPLQADQAQRSPMMDRFYDFYAGALLALKHQEITWTDTLGNSHATYYDVHTYDIGKYGHEVSMLTDSGALVKADAIVGPAYLKPVEVLSPYAQEHGIPVMIPFLQYLSAGVQKNPYMLKFNPSNELQAHVLMEHLDTLRSRINIVLVDAYADRMDYSQGIRILRDSIKSRGFSTTHTTVRQILADSVGVALKDSVENILLFHSERYSNVQLLMPYLLSGKGSKQLTILSQYAWQSERILLPQLFTSVFRIEGGEALERYEQDYALYFGHPLSSTQPRYDLLGYDLTRYMVEALKNGTFRAPETTIEGIQSSLLFLSTEDGGYENTHIVIERR